MNPPHIMEHNWLTDLITPLAVILAAIIQKLDARKVRKRLDHASVDRDRKLGAIHDLVNGNVAEQKRLNMMQARRIADLTGDPKDRELADESERLFKEHQERVLRVDLAMKTGDTDRIKRP